MLVLLLRNRVVLLRVMLGIATCVSISVFALFVGREYIPIVAAQVREQSREQASVVARPLAPLFHLGELAAPGRVVATGRSHRCEGIWKGGYGRTSWGGEMEVN
jgi:hypothetical protein